MLLNYNIIIPRFEVAAIYVAACVIEYSKNPTDLRASASALLGNINHSVKFYLQI